MGIDPIQKDAVETILEDFAKLRILVVGDVMLDHYIFGDAERISPEAPVPVVSVSKDEYVAGGAANVTRNLANLGIATTLIGTHGNDADGERLRNILNGSKINFSSLGRSDSADTIVKTRVVVQRQQLCRIDREQTVADYDLLKVATKDDLIAQLQNADAVIISDYAKGAISDPLLRVFVDAIQASEKKIVLALDPKPKRKLDLSNMSLMTPNWNEARQLAGIDEFEGSKETFETAVAESIYRQYKPHYLVITLGADGMLLCEAGKVIGRIATEAQEVFDVSGAGDTVIAVLTAALASGQALVNAAKLANRAAGIVVSHVGTTPIRAEEFLKAES